MSDPTDIGVVVEADASEAVSAVKEASDQLAAMLGNVKQLEAGLRGIFTNTIPAGMQQLKGLADQMQSVTKLPANLYSVQRVAANLASGGPANNIQRAAFRGVLNNVQSDPALMALRYEQEANKVAEARETIYRRLREAMPQATDEQLLQGYRQTLGRLGAAPSATVRSPTSNEQVDAARAARQKWFAETEAETKAFNAKMAAEYLAEEQAKYDKANAMYEAMMRRQAARLNPDQAEQRIQRISQYGTQRGISVDTDRLRSAYADERAKTYAVNGDESEAMQANAEQRIRQQLAYREARMSYQGGAPMFGIEAHQMANYALMGAGIGGAAYAGKSVLDFQSSLDGIKSDAGATDTEMSRLAKDIMAVGAGAGQSMKDLSDATDLLVKAGYNTQQAGTMLKPVSQLATATRSTAMDAADVVSQVMKTYNIAASQAPMVSNALAEISTKSKVSLKDMSTAFKDAGEFAKGTGMQFNEVLAAFGAMAAGGMKDGAQMGSGLKALITALDNPSAKLQAQLAKVGLTAADVNVQANGLGGALENMNSHGLTAAEAMTGLQARAFGVYEALSRNVDVYKQLDGSVLSSTAAVDGSTVRMGSLEEQWTRFLNVITKVAYEGGAPLLAMLTHIISALSAVLTVASSATPVIEVLGTVLGSLAASSVILWLTKLVAGFADMATGAGAVKLAATEAAVATEGLEVASVGATAGLKAMAVAFLATPLGWLTLGITAVSLGLQAYSAIQGNATAEVEKYGQAVQEASGKQAEYRDRMTDLDSYITLLVDRHEALSKNTTLAGQAAEIAAQKFGAWGLQISAQTRNVDDLINRLIELRRQQAAAGLEAAKDQNVQLGNQNQALSSQMSGDLGDAASSARIVLGNRRLLNFTSPTTRSALQQVANGNVTADNIQQVLAMLRKDKSAQDPAGYVAGIISSLNSAAPTASKIATNNSTIQANNQTIGNLTVQSSPQFSSFQTQISKLQEQQRQQELAAMQIKDPLARAKAEQEAYKAGDGRYAQAQQLAQTAASQISADPQTQGTALQTLQGTDAFQALAQKSLSSTPTDEKSWTARAQRLRAQAALARRQGDMSGYKNYSDQANHADLEAKAASPSFDPASTILEDTEGRDDARTAAGGITRGNRAASRQGTDYENQAKALLDKIKDQVGVGSPEAIQANQSSLTTQGAQYSKLMQDAARSKATGSGSTPKEIQDAVTRAQSDAQKTIAELLANNMATAKKALAEMAKQDATSTVDRLAAQGEDNEGPGLDKSLAEVKAAFAKAVSAQADALKAEYLQKHPEATDSQVMAGIQADLNKMKTEMSTATVKGVMTVIDAVGKGLKDAADEASEKAGQAIKSQMAQLNAASNQYNEPRLGSTHQYMIGQAKNQLDIQQAYQNQSNKKTALDQLNNTLGQKQAVIDNFDPSTKADDPALLDAEKSRDATQKDVTAAENAYKDATNTVTQLTSKVQTLATASDAVTAAWQKFGQQSAVVEPFWEQFADAASSVLDSLNGSFTKFLDGLTSGTEKPKKAFQDLGVSIFQSMQQAASKMLSNAMIKEIFSIGTSLFGSIGGAGAGVNASISTDGGYWQGGYVRRAQGGGMMTGGVPNRDSIPTLTAPGEFVLNSSAVSMIGKDTLDNINSAGNHIRTQTPTLAQAMPQRDPDMTNVYVVAPEAKPQMGKKDVVAAISDDMLSNGQTRKLVQAIAMGNL